MSHFIFSEMVLCAKIDFSRNFNKITPIVVKMVAYLDLTNGSIGSFDLGYVPLGLCLCLSIWGQVWFQFELCSIWVIFGSTNFGSGLGSGTVRVCFILG